MQTLKVLSGERITLPKEWCKENSVKEGQTVLSKDGETYGAPKGSLLIIPEAMADR